MTTLTDLARDANLSISEAWCRLDGLTVDNITSTDPLSPVDESMIRAALAPRGFTDCGCDPTAGHTSPCLLAVDGPA